MRALKHFGARPPQVKVFLGISGSSGRASLNLNAAFGSCGRQVGGTICPRVHHVLQGERSRVPRTVWCDSMTAVLTRAADAHARCHVTLPAAATSRNPAGDGEGGGQMQIAPLTVRTAAATLHMHPARLPLVPGTTTAALFSVDSHPQGCT